MKIVVLTNKNRRGACILRALKSNNIKIHAIIIESPTKNQAPLLKTLSRKMTSLMGYIKQGRYERMLDRFLEGVDALKQKLKPRRAPWKSEEYYRPFCEGLLVVENFNDANTTQILHRLGPDLLVVGGARILKEHIIRIPKMGIVNAHPGLLPTYRGEDTILWAVLNGEAVGVTVHFIDIGIDTGAIIVQERLAVTGTDTIESLSDKADELAGELMVKAVTRIRDGNAQARPQKTGEGKQYRFMPRRYYRTTRAKLKEMQKKMRSEPCVRGAREELG